MLPPPLCRLLAEQSAEAPPSLEAVAPSAAQLGAYARQQWEALLLFLVSGAGATPEPPAALRHQCTPIDVPHLLAAAGLMLKDEYTLAQSE